MTFIYKTMKKMKVSNLGRENSLPKFKSKSPSIIKLRPDIPNSVYEGFVSESYLKTLPYSIQDHYDRKQKDDYMEIIILENSKIKATFYPNHGGRLASIFDKEKKQELLFENPVFQPANLALRNAWFSGGIEWNCPIYGHSLLTCSPIYFAKFKIENQEILRIYEYDRLLNITWQIDFYLPESSNTLWYHVKVRNLNKFEIPFYWWTNIAVPLNEKTRVIIPSNETINHLEDGLGVCEWPIEKNIDISYPINYKSALSIFFLMPKEKAPWFAYTDENGFGLFHLSMPILKGKKLFFFGNGQGGNNWMNTLSIPGKGQYIELQAGVTETQSQTIQLSPNASLSWTACVGPLYCNPKVVNQNDYKILVYHAEEKLNETGNFNQVTEINKKMENWTNIFAEEIIHKGESWGRIHEKMSGIKIPGLLFNSAENKKEIPWIELITENKFSESSLSSEPISWNISNLWQQKLQESIKAGHNSWLHQLHLGVAYLEANKLEKAKECFKSSIKLKINFQSTRGLAIIELINGNEDIGLEYYMNSWMQSNNNEDLFNELSVLLREKVKINHLKSLIENCPNTILISEYYSIAKATVLLYEGEYKKARNLLKREYVYIKEGDHITTNIWFKTFIMPLEKKLKRHLTIEEKMEIKMQHQPPALIDFQMKN